LSQNQKANYPKNIIHILPSFTAVLAIVISLFLSGCGGSGTLDKEQPSPVPTPLTINAGSDQTVFANTTVTLSGSTSSNNISSYLWTQTSGTAVTLTNANSATTSFTSPMVSVNQVLIFQLKVTDDANNTATDSVSITVKPKENAALTANAGVDQTIAENSTVTLSGTTNSKNTSSYLWTQTSGAAVTFTNANSATTSFTSPSVSENEVLVFQFQVTKDTDDVATDSISITVQPSPTNNENTLYVAPNGENNNAGTIESPLKTFEGARNKVRTLISDHQNITVYFRAGTYQFDNTVILGPQDSGSANQSISYKGYLQEKAIFTSLVKLTNWTSYSGNVMQVALPAGITHTRYLHDESET